MACTSATTAGQQPVQCKNCFKHFISLINQEDACLYHPGNTVELRDHRARQHYPGQQVPPTPHGIQNFPKAFRWDCCFEDYVNGKPKSGCRKGSHAAALFGEAIDSTTRVQPKSSESPRKRKEAPTAAPNPVAKKPRVSNNPHVVQVVRILPSGGSVVVAQGRPQMPGMTSPQMSSARNRFPRSKPAAIVKPPYKPDPGIVKAEKRRAELLAALVADRPRPCDVCNSFRLASDFPTTKGGRAVESATMCATCCGEEDDSGLSVGDSEDDAEIVA